MDEAQSIWEDADVRTLFDLSSGRPMLRADLLSPIDASVFELFATRDQQVGMDSPVDDFIDVCLLGITSLEDRFCDDAPTGLRKFVTYQVALNMSIMWDNFRNAEGVRVISDWVISTCSNNGWQPDGVPGSPMGQRARWSLAIGAESGGGVRANPRTGRAEVPNGDEARAWAQDRFA